MSQRLSLRISAIVLFLAVLSLLVLVPAAAADTRLAPDDLVPLPGGCGGVLPPGEPGPVCCMSGYVYLDGQPVNGAKLTILGPGGSLTAWTELSDSPQPYYRVSLSDPPIQALAGTTITITAEYGAFTRTIT